jgi:hypothetical protein
VNFVDVTNLQQDVTMWRNVCDKMEIQTLYIVEGSEMHSLFLPLVCFNATSI